MVVYASSNANRSTGRLVSVLKDCGGSRLLYLVVCRILSKMASPFFSSLWRIQQPYGCTYIYQDRVRDFDAAMSAAAALAHL
jgi:hypothetical protein